jgi:metal-sulfur cluster biosynthetic enzyme
MENKYAGMTVNERLYESDLMDKFDIAVKEKNIKNITIILKKVELKEISINAVLEDLGLVNKSNSSDFED